MPVNDSCDDVDLSGVPDNRFADVRTETELNYLL